MTEPLTPKPNHTTLHVLVGLASFVILVAGMQAAAEILAPFLLALFFSIIFAPPLIWLQRNNVPTSAALVLVISCIIFVQLILFSFLSSSLLDFKAALPLYEVRLQGINYEIVKFLNTYNISFHKEIIENYLNPATIINLITKGLGGIGGVLSNAFFILLLIIFMLLEATSFPDKLHIILKDPQTSLPKLDEILEKIKRYIAIKTSMSFLTGCIITLWLSLVGVDYAILFGLLAFFLNYVPNIGSLLAAIPAVILAALQLGFFPAIFTGLGYLFVNNVIGNIFEPRIMGRTLGLSTLVVFVSLLFWGWVLGAVGMLLSIPLTMTLKLILESNPNTCWLAVLLESEAEAKKESEIKRKREAKEKLEKEQSTT